MNESPIAGITKVTAPNRESWLSHPPQMLLNHFQRWLEEKKSPNLGRFSAEESLHSQSLCALQCSPQPWRNETSSCLKTERYSHTLPTRNLADSSKIKTGTWCPVSHQRSGTDARDLLKDNYRRIYPQRKEDIQLILWWLFFALKHGSSYPFFWDEHTAIIYLSITPGLR